MAVFFCVYLINLSLENNIEISGSFFYKGKAVLYKLDIETINVKMCLFIEHALGLQFYIIKLGLITCALPRSVPGGAKSLASSIIVIEKWSARIQSA